MISVKIKHIPLKYFYYFQWFILGLHTLASRNEISFSIKPDSLTERFFLRFYSVYLGLRKYSGWFRQFEKEEYCLEGEISDGNRTVKFCYEIADCPYFFVSDYLEKTDVYFKAQHPTVIEKEGFPLTPAIRIQYDNQVHVNLQKIKPSMLGPSCRSNNIYSFRKLRRGLREIMQREATREGVLMSYFGNSKGPKPTFPPNPDLYNRETDILGYYGDRVSHPNEKRAIASRLITDMGEGYDGRVINDGHFGADGKPTNIHKFISLDAYGLHISKFKYNLNISGNRLSIPNRFIYSFAVGTAILTDKLHVRWYKPFDKEVVETVEMGYLKNDDVNWDGFIKSVKELPDINDGEVLEAFSSKWAPDIFAGYIIRTSLG
jgi:hypothetical protein